MTSRIIVNNIQSDTGVSSVTFESPILAPTFIGNVNATSGVTTFTTVNIGTGTSISSPTSNTLTFGVNNVERIRVNTTGVGVGTNVISRPFEVWAGTAGTSFSVDTVGRVQMPFQPTFCGISTYGSAFAGTSLTPMIFGGGANTYINQGNHYNTSTGFFTCPITGNYRVYVQGHLQEQSGYTTLRIRRNSITVSNAWHNASVANQSGGGSLVSGGIFNCSANDTLDVSFLTNRSANYIWETYWLLSITLVG